MSDVALSRRPYRILIECEGGRFAGYAPDFPGCIAVGSTLQEIVKKIDYLVSKKTAFSAQPERMVPLPVVL